MLSGKRSVEDESTPAPQPPDTSFAIPVLIHNDSQQPFSIGSFIGGMTRDEHITRQRVKKILSTECINLLLSVQDLSPPQDVGFPEPYSALHLHPTNIFRPIFSPEAQYIRRLRLTIFSDYTDDSLRKITVWFDGFSRALGKNHKLLTLEVVFLSVPKTDLNDNRVKSLQLRVLTTLVMWGGRLKGKVTVYGTTHKIKQWGENKLSISGNTLEADSLALQDPFLSEMVHGNDVSKVPFSKACIPDDRPTVKYSIPKSRIPRKPNQHSSLLKSSLMTPAHSDKPSDQQQLSAPPKSSIPKRSGAIITRRRSSAIGSSAIESSASRGMPRRYTRGNGASQNLLPRKRQRNDPDGL